MRAPAPRGPRLRELGLRIGRFDAGAANAITDVSGVTVGHVTVWRDEPEPPQARGIARTGVTAVLPGAVETIFGAPVPAGTAVLNGSGELTSSLVIREWGRIETPVYLTSTHAVGRVYDSAIEVAVAADPRVGTEDFVIPVVGECDDSWLSEGRVVQVEAADVGRAVADASGGAVAEGAVGGGTGMMTKGYKAGIGTASRIAPSIGGAVGVLVLSNFYPPPGLVMDGVSVGDLLGEPPGTRRSKAGSCIAVVAATLHSRRTSSSGSLGGPVSGSRAAARSDITAAARSSSRSPRPAVGPAERRRLPTCPTATSTTCSKQSSTRPRRRCSTLSGPRPRSRAARVASAARSPTTTCSSSSRLTAGSTPNRVTFAELRRGTTTA